MISLDVEATGLDLRHGAKPYIITTCNEENEITWFEWNVDPITREPEVVEEDLDEIESMLESEEIVFQNPKFDIGALETVRRSIAENWDWDNTYDCLLSGHLLHSSQPHDLTSMVLIYLGVNLQPYEDAVKKATEKARRLARSNFPEWRIAKKGLPEMPSAKEKVWKADMWLPRAFCRLAPYLLPEEPGWEPTDDPKEHSWWTVCSTYANSDSGSTLPLFLRHKELLEKKGLWKIYDYRRKILPVVYKMEGRGVTIHKGRKQELEKEYTEVAGRCYKTCINLPNSTELESLNGGNVLRSVLLDEFKLVSNKTTPKGNPSLDKTVIEHWLATLPPRSKARLFIKNLSAYRQRKTALSYMNGYESFWIPLIEDLVRPQGHTCSVVSIDETFGVQSTDQWYRLHPSLNPTGSATLRWSSSNPNEQNISKQKGFNIRYCFGPAPGREWWSIDANNIELRIPAYEAGEEAMIKVFESPNDPPFYGSYHMLVFAELWPEEFEKYGIECKERFVSTKYAWTKNGNFAVSYGAMAETADRAYHQQGAHTKVKRLFKAIHGPRGLNAQQIAQANATGFVTTIPDKTVDPDRGYPLYCRRSDYGKISPTIPLNYHVQSTAMWWMQISMVNCDEYLDTLPDHYMIMQVHDEIVFDFPFKKDQGNLPTIKKVAKIMESSGDNIGIPTPVSVTYHPNNWSEGIGVAI